MSTSKHIDKICIAAVCAVLALCLVFMCGGSIGIEATSRSLKYENTIFDTSYVHSVDIVMNDWDGFTENCENEEYSDCTVVIDGEKHANIAIRAKGNTSLTSVSSMGSQRYSFKLEFDHYEDAKTLDGLDKLCLNNMIQDNTMMKDYLVYRLMALFGADAPLCSFAYLTVNGEDWGLYLAIEGVEDSFLERNYSSEIGNLYKPDSMSFGAGRGNGKDFDMNDFNTDGEDFKDNEKNPQDSEQQTKDTNPSENTKENERSDKDRRNIDSKMPQGKGNKPDFDGDMGNDDVKLKYIDDDPDSYSNIFNNAKNDINKNDKERLINSLKNLSSYTDLENTVDTDEVIRYFVVHNFVCNGDSYTGSMVHNYYLHENDGKLAMIAWDYNLAFGTFHGNDASGTVNTSIDSPVSGGDVNDRPMLGWIFSNEEYTNTYHKLFGEFTDKYFKSGYVDTLISQTYEMIKPYVEKDPTKFCTTDEFGTGVKALQQFCTLRSEAVNRQLSGNAEAVDTTGLNLSDMGTMGGDKGGIGDDKMPSDMKSMSSAPPDSSQSDNASSKPPLPPQGEPNDKQHFNPMQNKGYRAN